MTLGWKKGQKIFKFMEILRFLPLWQQNNVSMNTKNLATFKVDFSSGQRSNSITANSEGNESSCIVFKVHLMKVDSAAAGFSLCCA